MARPSEVGDPRGHYPPHPNFNFLHYFYVTNHCITPKSPILQHLWSKDVSIITVYSRTLGKIKPAHRQNLFGTRSQSTHTFWKFTWIGSFMILHWNDKSKVFPFLSKGSQGAPKVYLDYCRLWQHNTTAWHVYNLQWWSSRKVIFFSDLPLNMDLGHDCLQHKDNVNFPIACLLLLSCSIVTVL